MRDNPMWNIIYGDSMKVLSEFEPGTFDAVITDPPYASGGRTQAEKNKSTRAKYSSMGEKAPPPFDGDAKDQRSWTTWCAQWLGEARRVSKPGAPVCVFIDWRQLPSLTDALQWARWDASASRQSSSSGGPTAICRSSGLCRVSPACSSTATRRTAST